MLDGFISKAQLIDRLLTERINEFLKPYYPGGELPYFSEKLPLLTKIIIYATIPLLLFSLLKLLYPDKGILNALLVLSLLIIIIASAGIFFGFFQLAYSF